MVPIRAIVLAAIILPLAGCADPAVTTAASLVCDGPCEVLVAEAGGYAWEPHVAVDPTDAQHLVAGLVRFVEGPAAAVVHDMLVAVSRDGGATWTSSSIPHGKDAPSGHPLASSVSLADPMVSFLPDGTVILSGLGLNMATVPESVAAQGFRTFVARSHDGGETFPEVVIIAEDTGIVAAGPFGLTGARLHAPDAPHLTVGPGGSMIYLWRWIDQASPAETQRSSVAFATSRDGGRTWSAPGRIDTGDLNAVPQPAIITSTGAILVTMVAWEGDEATAVHYDPWFARSIDGGTTWTTQEIGKDSWTAQMAEAAEGIIVAYAVYDADGKEVVTVRTSADEGVTFGPPRALTVPTARGQVFPTLAGDGTRAYLTYFHAMDPDHELRALTLGAGYVSAPITIARGITTPPGQLGEYFGLAALPDGAYAVWATNEAGGRFPGARIRLQ